MEEKLKANFNKTEQLQTELKNFKVEINKDIAQKILNITTEMKDQKQALEN